MATVLTNAGRTVLTNALLLTATAPKNVGWGTGAGTSVVTDTALFAEKYFDLATTTGSRTAGTATAVTTTVANDTHQVVATLTATGAGTVTNVGTFDNITIGAGNLFLHGDFAGITLAVGDSITFTVKTQFA